MEKDLPAPAGTAFTGKEQQRQPANLPGKPRPGKLSRKAQARQQAKAAHPQQDADKEDATAGDDFYSSVLERFGIQI